MILRDYLLGTPATTGCLLLKGAVAVVEPPAVGGGGSGGGGAPQWAGPIPWLDPPAEDLTDEERAIILVALAELLL